jgi:hypothetical protein
MQDAHHHTDFSLAFTDGRQMVDRDGLVLGVQVVHAGDLVVTTGRIIACDPYSFDAQAFSTTVPLGSHPVLLSIATFEANEHSEQTERVACALLRFTETMPVRWEPALTAGQDPSTLGPGELFGYDVEAGTGCFVDETAVNAWLQASSFNTEQYNPLFWENLDRWNARLLEEYFENGERLWANILIGEYGGINLIAFSSGWGDGGYATYAGYDADDQLVGLATDFRLLLGAHDPGVSPP